MAEPMEIPLDWDWLTLRGTMGHGEARALLSAWRDARQGSPRMVTIGADRAFVVTVAQVEAGQAMGEVVLTVTPSPLRRVTL